MTAPPENAATAPPSSGSDDSTDSTDIARPRLTDRLLLSPPKSLVVLTAPAGYSKTTTIRSWAAADLRPFVWIACDRRHDDPAFLIGSIASSLAPVVDIGEESIAALALEASFPELALGRLGELLAGSEARFALVIDDAHRLRSEASIAILQGLPEILPRNAQLVVGSRTVPPLHLGRARANRNLLELGPADLAMTRRESQRLLQSTGLDLGEHNLDSIYERTEGWPAALLLASLALAGSGDIDRAVSDFAGDDRAVAEYLQDEFLSTTDSETGRFMTRTSILEKLSGPLCDAVTGGTDSALKLRDLARSNGLVIPLDRKNGSFRYHHLFSDMLKAELLHGEPDMVRTLHTRASSWFEANAETELAVEHAIASEDICLAGRLIWASLPELSGRGRAATLNRWLDAVGRDRLTECLGLLFTAAHVSMMMGNGDEAAYLTSLASKFAGSDSCQVEAEFDLVILRATIPLDGTSVMGADAARALALSSPANVWHGVAALYSGVSVHLLGDPAAAVPILQNAVRQTAVASPIIQSLALAQLALISCLDGDRAGAARLISQARGQVDRCGLAEYPVMVLVSAVESMALAADGRAERALDVLDKGLLLLDSLKSFPPWYEAETRLAFASGALRLGDMKRTQELLSQARAHLTLSEDAVVLREWLESLESEVGTLTGNRETRTSNLTRAEFRTLKHLPTHLTFRQIGEVDHVSANTVKTQARSIYRKLGVSSRAEAVEAAREAGLFD